MQTSCDWIDFGNLAIGIGTFSLAIVLAFVNWRSSSRDRKVHIANKRHDWIKEFRVCIAEFLSEISNVDTAQKLQHFEDARGISKTVTVLVNKTRLLLDENNEYKNELLDQMRNYIQLVMVEGRPVLFDQIDTYDDQVIELDNKVYSIAKKIIEEEWGKIKNLDD